MAARVDSKEIHKPVFVHPIFYLKQGLFFAVRTVTCICTCANVASDVRKF